MGIHQEILHGCRRTRVVVRSPRRLPEGGVLRESRETVGVRRSGAGMLKKTQESIGLRGACWNGRERTSLAKRAGVCMGSQECEGVVRGAQEFARIRKIRRDRVMQKRAGVRSMLLLRRWEENPGRLSTVGNFARPTHRAQRIWPCAKSPGTVRTCSRRRKYALAPTSPDAPEAPAI